MTVSEQIKILCVRSNISQAELARRIGCSPQSFNAKMKRGSFSIPDMQTIAAATGSSFECNFVLYNGEKINGGDQSAI